HARDLTGLRGFLGRLTTLREGLAGLTAPLLAALGEDITSLPALHKLLEDALEDDPPSTLRDGGPTPAAGGGARGERGQAPRAARRGARWAPSMLWFPSARWPTSAAMSGPRSTAGRVSRSRTAAIPCSSWAASVRSHPTISDSTRRQSR